MNLWPNDVFVEQEKSTRDIMISARTKHVLSVAIRARRLTDRIVLGFIVTNETYSLEYNLFEASHRPKLPYPVVIDPPVSDIPDFLKRERSIPGSPGLTAHNSDITMKILGTPATTVKNEWVCATPDEFTEKLKALFAMDYVKSNIVSLQAPTSVEEAPNSQSESTKSQDPVEELENETEDELLQE
jgi:hypothetical protein